MLARIKALIAEKKISDKCVAEFIGVEPPAFSKMMGGKQKIPQEVVIKFAELFNVSTDFLYGRTCPALDGWLKLPILGEVPAGNPTEAIELIIRYFSVSEDLKNQMDFGLIVKGDSMTGAGINDGDVVFVKHQPVAENRQIIVARLDGAATVKRFFRTDHSVILKPENPNFDPILVDATREFSIVGVVTGLWRQWF